MRPRTSCLELLLVSAALSGCSARPAGSRAGPLAAGDPAFAAYYAPLGTLGEAKVEPAGETRRHRRFKVEIPFEAPAGTPEAGRRPVKVTWYEPLVPGAPAPPGRPPASPGPPPDPPARPPARPQGPPPEGAARRPLVLISPILGSDTDFVEGFAEAFAARGWHAAIVKRPKLAYDEARPLSQVEDGMRVAVMRQRRALDWFLARGDVDPARVGSFGISAGGILGSVVAAADPRYAGHVLCLAGGPLADVLVETSEAGLEDLVDRALAREGMSREALRKELLRVVRTDPVALGHRVDPGKVLLFLARFDRTVPTRCGRALWRAMGEPAMVMVPLGHYTSILLLPWVRSRTVEFLEERFAEAASR